MRRSRPTLQRKTRIVSAVARSSLAVLLLMLAAAAWPDWRQPDAANLLYMQLPHGEVVMELAPGFAAKNVANIRILAREKYFDGLAIVRSQDNYVVQWADPAEDQDNARSLGICGRLPCHPSLNDRPASSG